MFTKIVPSSETQVTIYFEDAPLRVDAGMTVAAAVLQAGHADARVTARKHDARGPFCQMGVCYECLMEIDGKANQQSCLITVQDGMCVKRQNGEPRLGGKGGE